MNENPNFEDGYIACAMVDNKVISAFGISVSSGYSLWQHITRNCINNIKENIGAELQNADEIKENFKKSMCALIDDSFK